MNPLLSFCLENIKQLLNIYTPVVNVNFFWETFHIELSKWEKQVEVRYKDSI